MRERTETDAVTGETTLITEKWMVYTVIYNGETYFADTVFGLDADQKLLASDYAENLSLFLGDGIFQNFADYNSTNAIPSLGDVRSFFLKQQ